MHHTDNTEQHQAGAAAYVPDRDISRHAVQTPVWHLRPGDLIAETQADKVVAGIRWIVTGHTHNGWISLTAEKSTGVDGWEPVPGHTRKIRANANTVLQIISPQPFHHIGAIRRHLAELHPALRRPHSPADLPRIHAEEHRGYLCNHHHDQGSRAGQPPDGWATGGNVTMREPT